MILSIDVLISSCIEPAENSELEKEEGLWLSSRGKVSFGSFPTTRDFGDELIEGSFSMLPTEGSLLFFFIESKLPLNMGSEMKEKDLSFLCRTRVPVGKFSENELFEEVLTLGLGEGGGIGPSS